MEVRASRQTRNRCHHSSFTLAFSSLAGYPGGVSYGILLYSEIGDFDSIVLSDNHIDTGSPGPGSPGSDGQWGGGGGGVFVMI